MERLLDTAAAMTQGLTERDFCRLSAENARTFGQRLYLEHGITGVRGEAELGFPLVRKYGYPTLEAGLAQGRSLNDAGCAALLALMARNTDTNIIHRSSLAAQRQVMQEADALLSREAFPSAAVLTEFDQALIDRNISPGGSADLLALCYLLHSLKEDAE